MTKTRLLLPTGVGKGRAKGAKGYGDLGEGKGREREISLGAPQSTSHRLVLAF